MALIPAGFGITASGGGGGGGSASTWDTTGAGAPTQGAAGFALGTRYIDNVTGYTYINVGSTSSCSFQGIILA